MASLLIKSYEQILHKPSLPKESFTLAFLTDFHNGSKERAELIMEALRHVRPDLVLIGGDMLTALPGLSFAPALYLLDGIKDEYPIYYAFGNHEYRMMIYEEDYLGYGKAFMTELEKRHIPALRNQSDCLMINDMPVRITGFELPAPYYKKFKKMRFPVSSVEELIGASDPSRIQILLAHNPVFSDSYLDWGADLTLCGHMHGGLVRIFGHPLIGTDGHFFPRYGYGRLQKGSKNLIISSGLGEHTFPIRIANQRELVCATMINQ